MASSVTSMSGGMTVADFVQRSRPSSMMRSSIGCWTCRLRRKKCGEEHPVCDVCATLHITCYYSHDKPQWMDSGVRQESMAEQLKREVRENGHRYGRGERAAQSTRDRTSVAEATTGDCIMLPQEPARNQTATVSNPLETTADINRNVLEPCPEAHTIWPQRGATCTFTTKNSDKIEYGLSDTILLMFYLDHLLPFLFPFYRPSLLDGGRAWVLEMMISSPVLRQATLCQSSYFFSLARGTDNVDVVWETVLTQTRDAFRVLRQSLQVIEGSNIADHLHGAVRVLASIMQVQRFEIAVLSFNNCRSHLDAALALFKSLLEDSGPAESCSSFNAVLNRLGPISWDSSSHCIQFPSAEQAAFRFSASLLVLDDIIASTMLQERPRLYAYHHSLLVGIDSTGPPVNLEATVGCQNWALLQIGEIAVLDAWKKECKQAGNLDVMELVHRATVIKDSLEANFVRLETDLPNTPDEGSSLLDMFTKNSSQDSKALASHTLLVTRVWAHSALLYLFVVVSGWQPASADVRYHVGRILELLAHHISPPALLRTMAWPFCVAGCLAEPGQEACFRGMVEVLQPTSVFGTVRKALEFMEVVWQNRDEPDAASRDFAACFKNHGDLVLLV